MIPRLSTSTHIQSSPRTRTSRAQQSTQTPPRPSPAHRTTTPTLSRPSSSSGTSRQRPTLLSEPMEPISPTPRKTTRRGRRAGAGPSKAGKVGEDGWEDTNTAGEEELFGLLGVISPPTQSTQAQVEGEKGVLAISKADIEASSGATHKKTRRGRRYDPNHAPAGQTEALGQQTMAGCVKKDGRRGARGPKAAVPELMESTTQSESDTPVPALGLTPQRPSRTRQPKAKSNTPSKPISALSAQIASHPNPQVLSQHLAPIPVPTASSSTFEMSSLSRSLPSEAMFAHPPPPSSAPPIDQHKADEIGRKAPHRQKGKGRKKIGESEDESKVWDEPMDPGPAVAEDLTWQQRLGSYPNADSPSRSNPSSHPKKVKAPHTTSRPSPLNPRPTHSRRSSADALPLPSHNRHTSFPTTTTTSSSRGIPKPPPSAYPLSSFDTLPPFNPAMNVHRAPQTPAKNGLASKYAVMELPIKSGSFPRINGSGSQTSIGHVGEFGVGGLDAGKYAGASFHNSPHGRALPKPDMEDF